MLWGPLEKLNLPISVMKTSSVFKADTKDAIVQLVDKTFYSFAKE